MVILTPPFFTHWILHRSMIIIYVRFAFGRKKNPEKNKNECVWRRHNSSSVKWRKCIYNIYICNGHTSQNDLQITLIFTFQSNSHTKRSSYLSNGQIKPEFTVSRESLGEFFFDSVCSCYFHSRANETKKDWGKKARWFFFAFFKPTLTMYLYVIRYI